jgi:serine/threonine-protein kinase
MLAFVARPDSQPQAQLYVRSLDRLDATPLAGTSGARNPFFSPDGRWIGFFAEGELKKIQVTGGTTVALAEARRERGGAWGDDGRIVFAPFSRGGLLRVPADGGTPESLTALVNGEVTHRWPQVLPGSRALLYTAHTSGWNFDHAAIVVESLEGVRRRVIVHKGGSFARYADGRVTWFERGSLFAVPFDLHRLAATGPAVPLVDGVASDVDHGGADFDVTVEGGLAYVGGSPTQSTTVQWLNAQGVLQPITAFRDRCDDIAIAPDGERIAVDVGDRARDILIYDWKRDISTRLTFGAGDHSAPVWSPDGKHIAYSVSADRGATGWTCWIRSDGTSQEQRLTDTTSSTYPESFHPSGRFLAVDHIRPGGLMELSIVALDGGKAAGWSPAPLRTFAAGPGNAGLAKFSPDGRWLAYVSSESGRGEIYVRPFPGPGGKWQVSVDGGVNPAWSAATHGLLYLSLDGALMVTPYTTIGETFVPGRARPWVERASTALPAIESFAVSPDGRVAILPRLGGESRGGDHVTLVTRPFEHVSHEAPN